MKRTIVSLISEHTTPNFLFIKEMREPGNRLLFISPKRFEARIDWIIKALGYTNCMINSIIMPDGVEEKWDKIIKTIKRRLSKDEQYIVNLTCGNKYLITAIPKVFEGYDAEFYFIPTSKNVILKLGDESRREINYRISVSEYFDCNNTVISSHKELTEKEDYTQPFFHIFLNRIDMFAEMTEKLRYYRNKNIGDILLVEKEGIPKVNENSRHYPPVKGLLNFLRELDFPIQLYGKLSKQESFYLTGGWFEEYVYTKIREKIAPQDLMLGVILPFSDNKNSNKRDLDIVFTYENKLFIIECKVSNVDEKPYNEMVYKAASLRSERLSRLLAHTYIFSLFEEDERFVDVARAMNISFYDKSFFIDEEKFGLIIADIIKKANG